MKLLSSIWKYTVNHKWSKDILRANLFYIVLVLLFDLLHFGLRPIGWSVFGKMWFLMNFCLLFKLALDIIDRLLRKTSRSR